VNVVCKSETENKHFKESQTHTNVGFFHLLLGMIYVCLRGTLHNSLTVPGTVVVVPLRCSPVVEMEAQGTREERLAAIQTCAAFLYGEQQNSSTSPVRQ